MEVLFYFFFFTMYPNNPLVLLLYSSVLCFMAIHKVSWSFSVDTNTSHFKTQRHEVGALTHAATHTNTQTVLETGHICLMLPFPLSGCPQAEFVVACFNASLFTLVSSLSVCQDSFTMCISSPQRLGITLCPFFLVFFCLSLRLAVTFSFVTGCHWS